VQKDRESFKWPEPIPEFRYAALTPRQGTEFTRLSAFDAFFPLSLLEMIWKEERNGPFELRPGGLPINSNHFCPRLIYKFLAIKVRILRLHEVPSEHIHPQECLRRNVKCAIERFAGDPHYNHDFQGVLCSRK